MRDQAVEAMVEVAQSCAPGGTGIKADAVRAVRMCLDILELMKLVIIFTYFLTAFPDALGYPSGYRESSIADITPFPHRDLRPV
jgi:hypothetical protein